MQAILIPALLLLLLVFSLLKKESAYNHFVIGSKKSFALIMDIFPYILAIMLAVSLFRVSGLSIILIKLLTPIFQFLGIPPEVSELVLLRPFSGSGSLAVLKNILTEYGVDSYIGRSACAIMGSSETTFYVATIYFSQTSVKKVGSCIVISLIGGLVGAIIACLCCKIF